MIAGFSMFLGAVPVRAWLVIQWLWLLWPFVLVLHPQRSIRGVLIPCVIGLLLVVPNAFWLWAYTAWEFNGFAP
jgi:hypothetical protein